MFKNTEDHFTKPKNKISANICGVPQNTLQKSIAIIFPL